MKRVCLFAAAGCLALRAFASDPLPPEAEAAARRGIELTDERKWQEAEVYWAKAAQLAPRSPRALAGHCGALLDLKRGPEAFGLCNRSLQLDPREAVALYNRAWLYFETGQYDRALSDVDRIPESKRWPRSWETRALINVKLDRCGEALQDYQHAADADVTYAQAYVSRAMLYSQIGDQPQAIRDFSNAIAVEPENMEYYRTRALAQKLNGDLPREARDKRMAANPRQVSAARQRETALLLMQLHTSHDLVTHTNTGAQLKAIGRDAALAAAMSLVTASESNREAQNSIPPAHQPGNRIAEEEYLQMLATRRRVVVTLADVLAAIGDPWCVESIRFAAARSRNVADELNRALQAILSRYPEAQ